MPEPQRRYAFTHYDIQPPKFDPDKHYYLCFQREICPNSRRVHWQAYVELVRTMRYKTMWKSMGLSTGGHIEEAKATALENKNYCHKLETRFPGAKQFEFGTPMTQGQRTDLRQA